MKTSKLSLGDRSSVDYPYKKQLTRKSLKCHDVIVSIGMGSENRCHLMVVVMILFWETFEYICIFYHFSTSRLCRWLKSFAIEDNEQAYILSISPPPTSRTGPGLGVTKQKSMLNSMLVYKDFLIWLLIGWRLCCQPIRCQVWKSLLTNMDFNMEIS